MFSYFNGPIPQQRLLQQARNDAKEWYENVMQLESPLSQRLNNNTFNHPIHWTKPDEGLTKYNVDGSFIDASSSSQAGQVLRDSNGYYQGAAQGMCMKVNNAQESKF